MLITDISRDFLSNRKLLVEDLTNIVIPVDFPVFCELYYNSVRPTQGIRLDLYINGNRVTNITYLDGEQGLKQSRLDLTNVLTEGENEFRCLCLVSCLQFEEKSDEGLIWLKGKHSTIIKKKYSTRGSLEPFDQRWNLLVSSRNY
jgi:hypothetical protein